MEVGVEGTVASWLDCSGLWIKQSAFKPWQGTLCCVLEKDFFCLLAQCNPVMDSHPIQVASCYRNWDKFWPDGPLGLYTDCTLLT